MQHACSWLSLCQHVEHFLKDVAVPGTRIVRSDAKGKSEKTGEKERKEMACKLQSGKTQKACANSERALSTKFTKHS